MAKRAPMRRSGRAAKKPAARAAKGVAKKPATKAATPLPKAEVRTRGWLRRFVNLGARARQEHIRPEVIELQEDTVLAALEILEREPGVLLADEVGMGKTFQTLGLLAITFEHDPKAKVIVVTPTRELNEQWYWFAQRFGTYGFYPFQSEWFATVNNLRELPELARTHRVVFAPLPIFSGARAHQERGFLLALWAKYCRLPAARLGKIKKRIQAAGVAVAPGREFLGRTVNELAGKSLKQAFSRPTLESRGFRGLSDLNADGLEAFDSSAAVRRALDRARFHVVSTLMPAFQLLVVDEAHKLKDPWTVRAQAVALVLRRNYEKAIFLTATPFQLGINELKQVFTLFDNARTARPNFMADVERLFGAVRVYQEAYDRFRTGWRYMDALQARDFARWYERASETRDPDFERIGDPNVRLMAFQAWRLIELKKREVQPSFRQWTLRSLKPGKHERRDTRVTRLLADEEAVLPMVLYQRLLLEVAPGGRQAQGASTAANTDINMASSFAAVRASRPLRAKLRDRNASAYQKAVQTVLEAMRSPHPKLHHVLGEVIEAALRGEKTLIFCERNASIRVLQQGLETAWLTLQLDHWNRVCPGASFEEIFGSGTGPTRVRGVGDKMPPRFYRGSDELSLALTESLPHTLLVPAERTSPFPEELWQASGDLLEHANKVLKRQRVTPAVAARLDYPLASRCIDHAVAHWFKNHRSKIERLRLDAHGGVAKNLLDPQYPERGLSLAEVDRDKRGNEKVTWSISRATFNTIFRPRRPGIWYPFRGELGAFPAKVRVLIVEAVRYFLTRREVALLAELLERVGTPQASSVQLREAIELWWAQDQCAWRHKVKELLEYLPCLTPAEQVEVLNNMLRSPRVVQNSLTAASRTARQNAFNAPFYPLILIGNQGIQQGLDLHRQCRRIVHYDLRWSPTDLEQRIGRVERHGSLAERFDASQPEGKIQIMFPLLDGTGDPILYRSVRVREKWMEFLLGQPPLIGDFDLNEAPPQPLPPSLVQNLRVELGPRQR